MQPNQQHRCISLPIGALPMAIAVEVGTSGGGPRWSNSHRMNAEKMGYAISWRRRESGAGKRSESDVLRL